MKKINERLVTVSRAYIPTAEELELGDDIRLTIDATVTEIRDVDNHDGTINKVYKVKGIGTYGKNRNPDNKRSSQREIIDRGATQLTRD